MPGSRIPEDVRRWILADRQRQMKADTRKRRLYNRYFRKGLFYVSSLLVRVLYCILFFVVMFNYNQTSFSKQEVYQQCWSDHYGGGRNSRTYYYLKTNHNTYHLSVDFRYCEKFDPLQPVTVDYNCFHKPLRFYQKDWDISYGIYINYIYYYMLLFATLLTFFFNDGLDRFTVWLLYGFYALDLISIALFFVF